MKSILFLCFVSALFHHIASLGYHEDVGIPEAARIRRTEMMTGRIIGGSANSIYDYPYLAGILITLQNRKMSICSGTLLNSKKVLTAGQCWYDGYLQGKKAQVVLGSSKLFTGYAREASSVVLHPEFNPINPSNDLAIMTLYYSVSFSSYVKPVTLPPSSLVNETFVGSLAIVAGFGKTNEWTTIGPDQQQSAVSVPVIQYYECYWSLGTSASIDSRKNLCTSGSYGRGACDGDLGGPLAIKNYSNATSNGTNDYMLIGVTSVQSPIGCQNGFATAYVRVTAFLPWITSNL